MTTSEDSVTSPSYGSGGLFSSSRNKPFPSIFPSYPTAVTYDVLYVGMLTAFLVVFLSFLTIFPTFKGWGEKVKVFLRVASCLILGVVIMACNYGQNWEVGVIRTGTPYRAGSGQEIKAELGIHLGLRSVNITLKALEEPRGELKGEKIDYNERFAWTWAQGNAGYGPNAGAIQRAYRLAQETGLPLPILWVAEYFTIDGEGIRFGRYYRSSGWFAHICVWTAFPLWILTMILFKMVIRIAAQTLVLTGIMLLTSAVIWASNRNHIELQIPFQDGILTTTYGLHWYLALVVGTLCIAVGTFIYLYDSRYPGKLSWVFGNNPLRIVEEETVVEEDRVTVGPGVRKMRMQTAGRRVVTTLRACGTSHCLKKISEGEEGDVDGTTTTTTTLDEPTLHMTPSAISQAPGIPQDSPPLSLSQTYVNEAYKVDREGGPGRDQTRVYPGSE